MGATPLIIAGLAANLAVFIAYPETGRMGLTFLYVSCILWTAFAFFLGRHVPSSAGSKLAQTLGFALACAFSALTFLPQKDNTSALSKLAAGSYPDNNSVYIGLARLGINCPSLLPPPKEEVLP